MIKPLDRTGTWQTYSMADGLAGMRIEHIAEDSQGYLWFASWDNGASRFDGDTFETFGEQDGLVNNRVYFIQQDSRDRLWFGTLNGVCWYDGADFHHLEDAGIAGRPVQFIYEDRQGRIWCGGHRTLGYYDGTVFHDLIPLYLQDYEQPPSPQWPNQCRGIAQDPEGHLWFGYNYLIRFDGTSFHRYEEKEGFPKSRISYAVGQDNTDKVWIGHHEYQNKFWYYTDGNFHSVQVDLEGVIRKIQCDHEGRMWLSTSEGVLYQDGEGFSRFTVADGLPDPAVKAMVHNSDHQYWFATWGGVVLYDTHSISIFNLSAGFSSNVSAKYYSNVSEISQIVQDRKGDIWVGSISPHFTYLSKSVFRLEGKHFEHVSTEDGSDINNCYAIYEDRDGCLWFGGRNGLFRYDGQKFEKIKTGDRGISAIVQDSQGQFIFGFWEGNSGKNEDLFVDPLQIVYQEGEQFQTIFEEKEDKDPFSRISTVIAGRNGEVYFYLAYQNFSDDYKGLACWHPEDGLKFYRVEDGLIDNKINDLLLDRDGNLWIATPSGLCCFDGTVFRSFTNEDGLPGNRIHCLFEDSQGHLWLGTDGGVAHYNGQLFQTINSPYIGSVLRIFEDRDGNFWFGTIQNTLVRYRQQKIPPRIRLLSVIADQDYENLEEVIVSTTDQHVIFEYKGLSFSTHSSDMLYVYHLKGYDSDWQPATRKMRAFYRDLPPGDYTFQVKTIDRDLNYSEAAQARLSITTDPRIEALTAVINGQGSQKLIGHSAVLRQFQSNLKKIASTDMTVLIMGETGTGKGLAARTLHGLSANGDGPFIEFSCGALPGALINSELFGHEKGAFTSAVSHRLGRVELAEGGTLFLDEIGDMTLEMQIKLLRLLEEGTFERIGSSETLKVQARIVAATNRNLADMVRIGDFREDLYYRLNVFPLYLPPLRERKEDIPELAEYFKNRLSAHIGKQIVPLTPEVIEVLQAYDWPGNVRELEHTIQRAVILCPDSQIQEENLILYSSQIEATDRDLNRQVLEQDREVVPLYEFERRYILDVLKATNYQIKGPKGAAALLGLPPSTLYSKMERLKIKQIKLYT